MKGRESGDVRLILDTKGARVAEGKCRTVRPLSELQNIGAGDTERTEAPLNTHYKPHTCSFVKLEGKFADILSHAHLNMNL